METLTSVFQKYHAAADTDRYTHPSQSDGCRVASALLHGAEHRSRAARPHVSQRAGCRCAGAPTEATAAWHRLVSVQQVAPCPAVPLRSKTARDVPPTPSLCLAAIARSAQLVSVFCAMTMSQHHNPGSSARASSGAAGKGSEKEPSHVVIHMNGTATELGGRIPGLGTEGQTSDRASIGWFTFQVPATARAQTSCSQEPGAPSVSPMWVRGPKSGHSPAASQGGGTGSGSKTHTKQ